MRLRSSSIKVATLSHTPAQILSNISKAIPAIASHIPGSWDNIQSLMIKTNTSVSLPIWSCNLDERWTGLVKGGNEGEKEEVLKKPDDKSKKKEQARKKRPVQEDKSEESEEEEQPRKKVKSDEGESAPVTSPVTKPATKPAAKPATKPAAKPATRPTKNSQRTQPVGTSSTDQKSKKTKSGAPTSLETQAKQKLTKKDQQESIAPTETKKKTKPQSESSSEENKGLMKTELKRKQAGVMLGKKGKVVGAKAGLNRKSAKAKILGKKVLQA